MLSKKVYRGTKLSEGLRIIDENIPKKTLYRITDKEEAHSYALANKLEDAQARGSIVQANLRYNKKDLLFLSHEQYLSLYQGKDSRIYTNKIAVVEFSKFRIYIISPKYHSTICDAKIIEVV